MAPPFISMVAASGTTRTLKPICDRVWLSVARAVVLPAQGPPVRHILMMGNLLCPMAFEWSRVESFILVLCCEP